MRADLKRPAALSTAAAADQPRTNAGRPQATGGTVPIDADADGAAR
jgi:hypothetical protein